MNIKIDVEKIRREEPQLLNMLSWYHPDMPGERSRQGWAANCDYLEIQRPDGRPMAVIIPKGYVIEE